MKQSKTTHTTPLERLSAFATVTSTAWIRTILILTTCVCNAVVAVSLTTLPPASGYEGSIYAAYPPSLWAVFIAGLAAALLLILHSATVDDHYWRYGLAFTCSLYGLFHLLPLFRGWAMYGRGDSDVLSHIGVAREILRTGMIPANDWYPVVHVLIAELNGLGLRLDAVSSVLSAFFTPLYIVLMYLLGRQLLGSKKAGLAVLAWSVPLLYAEFHQTLHPAIFSFLLLPALLITVVGAYNSERTLPYVILLGSFGVLLLLFHPITTIHFVGMLCISLVTRYGYGRLTGRRIDSTVEAALVSGLTLGWLVWYLQFAEIRGYIQRVTMGASGTGSSGGSVSVAAGIGSQIQDVQSAGQFVAGFLTDYGPLFFVSLLAGLAVLDALLWYFWTGNHSLEDTWLTLQFGAGAGITAVGLFVYIVAANPIRNSRYMILFGTLLAGAFLYRALDDRLALPSGRLAQVAVLVLLLSSLGLSVMTTYQHNYHMTHAEERGTEWYYEHNAPATVGIAADVSYKMRSYIQGGEYGSAGFREFGSDTSPLERGFGYATHDSVGGAVGGFETYIATKPYDLEAPKQLHPSVRSEHTLYTERDLQRLRTDRSANRVYANGGYTLWHIDSE